MKAVKKDTTAKETTKVVSLSDRIQLVRNQSGLVKKWERLQDYRKKLDSFKFGNNEVAQRLEISDGDLDFETTKTEHCELVVSELIKLVDSSIEEVEAAIAA